MSWSLGRTMCGMLTWYFFLRFFSLRQTPSNSAAPNIDSKESEEEEVFSCVMLYQRSSFAGFSWCPMPTSMVRTAHICWSYACSSQGRHSWFREWENKSWKTQSLKSQRNFGNIYDIFRTFHHQCCFKVRVKQNLRNLQWLQLVSCQSCQWQEKPSARDDPFLEKSQCWNVWTSRELLGGNSGCCRDTVGQNPVAWLYTLCL